MQIIESTADWIIEESDIDAQRDEYKNPEINIQMGSWYLRYLLDYFGEKEVSLAAYNAGMGNVNKWLKNEKYSKDGKSLIKIPFKETRDYVRKVLMSEEIYKLLYFR